MSITLTLLRDQRTQTLAEGQSACDTNTMHFLLQTVEQPRLEIRSLKNLFELIHVSITAVAAAVVSHSLLSISIVVVVTIDIYLLF